MFTRILALLPFEALVAASHVGVRGQTASQCNTGTLSCRESVQTAEQASNVLAANNLLDVVGEVFGLVGTQCTPITGIGAGTACAAQQQPVCCTDNDMNGLINWGCSPININA